MGFLSQTIRLFKVCCRIQWNRLVCIRVYGNRDLEIPKIPGSTEVRDPKITKIWIPKITILLNSKNINTNNFNITESRTIFSISTENTELSDSLNDQCPFNIFKNFSGFFDTVWEFFGIFQYSWYFPVFFGIQYREYYLVVCHW